MAVATSPYIPTGQSTPHSAQKKFPSTRFLSYQQLAAESRAEQGGRVGNPLCSYRRGALTSELSSKKHLSITSNILGLNILAAPFTKLYKRFPIFASE